MSEALEEGKRLIRRLRLGARGSDAEEAVIPLANYLIDYGVAHHASDIHLEPGARDVRIRYRIDGVLEVLPERLPLALGETLAARLKVMGKMDSAQRTRPLDGSIAYELADGRKLDVRVSSIPSVYGETLVLRLMDVEERLLTLDELGYLDEDLAAFRALIRRPAGLIVLAGPMNSGKTTTLYAALSALNEPETSLMTLEDPIERKLAGITQVQVNEKAGLTYMSGLRAVLRQDAEKILLGEVRDEETAEMAVRIALTGHLVLTTLHAANAITAIYRLLEMRTEPYLLAETLAGITSQRLVRRLAPEGTGRRYAGRLALTEVLPVTDEIRDLIVTRAPRREMVAAARRAGLRTLREDAREKVRLGLTPEEETGRVLNGIEE